MAKSRPTMSPKRTNTDGPALAGRGALFLFDGSLALDAVPRVRQRLEALVRNGLPAALAVAEATLGDLLQRQRDLFQSPAVAVAQLEEELAIVGRRGLVTQVLDGIVFGALPIEDGLADLLYELAMLLLELPAELHQAVLLHRGLLPRHDRRQNTRRGSAARRAGYHGV